MTPIQNSRATHRASLIKTGGVYPNQANPEQISKINDIYKKLISSIGVSEDNGMKISYPSPILDHLPNQLVGWPSEKIDQAKIFAHVFSGSYLIESGLEGIGFSVVSSYVEKWFHYFAKVSKASEILKFVQANIPYLQSLQVQEKELAVLCLAQHKDKTLETLQRLADQRMQTVVNLPEGIPYLMIGGGNGKPCGHAMLYEFIRKGKTFELRVFNTGFGTNYHFNMIQGTKQKISPILLKVGIPEEELNLFFFQSLLEPLILPSWQLPETEVKTEELIQFIYRMIDQLKGTTVHLDPGYNRLTTAQRAGTCSFDSLMAYLQYRAGESGLGLFEQIRLCLRLGTLNQGEKSWSKDLQALANQSRGFRSYPGKKPEAVSTQQVLDTSSQLMALLENGAQRVLSDSVKPVFLKEKLPWFSLKETVLAQNTAHDVLSLLGRLRSEIHEKALHEKNAFSLKSNDQYSNARLISSLTCSLLDQISSNRFFLGSPSSVERLSLSGKFLSQWEPNQCASILKKQIEKIMNGSASWTPIQIQAEIRWLIESLPVPKVGNDDFWQKIPDSDLVSCCASLDILLKMYFEHFPADAIAVIPEDQNVIFSVLTMLHTLTLRSEKLYVEPPPRSLSQYRIAPPTKLLEDDPYTVLFSAFSLKRRQEILDYFSDYNRTRSHCPILYDFSSSFARLSYYDIKFVEALRNREDFRYYLHWVERFEGILENRGWAKPISHLFRSINNLMSEGYGFLFFQRRKDISINLYEKEKKALSMMLDPSSVFSHGVYSPLVFLRNAALTSHLSAGSWDKTEKQSSPASEQGIQCLFAPSYELNWIYRIYYSFKNRESGLNQWCSIPQKTWKGNRSIRLHTNNPTDLISFRKENEYKLRPKSMTEGDVLPLMDLRNVVDPLARPLQILNAAEHKIPFFKLPQERIHFMIDLSGSNLLNPDSDELVTPLKSLCGQTEFIKRCDDFILNGLNYYWNYPKKSDRDISATLFFIRISQLINEWIPTAEIESRQLFTRQFMRRVLEEETIISSEDKIEIYTHLILSYEKKNPSELSHDEICEIFNIWFKLDRNFTMSQFSHPYSAYRAQNLIWELLPGISDVFSRSPALSQKVAETIWKEGGHSKALKWEYDPKDRKFKSTSGENTIALDLQNRTTRINDVDTYRSFYLPEKVIQVPGFERIFGERRPSRCQFSDQSGQGIIYFKDSIWGDIQIHLQEQKSVIIRVDNEGRRYGLISDPDFCSKHIPLSIRHQSVLWVPLSQKEVDPSGLLCDPKTGKILYHIREHGAIYRDQENRSLKLIPSPDVLHRIEGTGNVLTWEDKKGDILIEYPFLLSYQQRFLEFNLSSNKANSSGAIWKENPEFRIAENQQNGLLGTSDQYLLLEHIDTKKRKIIVPLIMHDKFTVLSSYHAFNRDFSFDDRSGVLENKKDRSKQDPKAMFFVFDLENNRPVGRTPAENIMLSYLFFAQRDFQTSLRYLNQIEKKNRFSEAEWSDLWNVIQWMHAINDCSVEAKGLLLRAFTFVRDELRHPHNFFSNQMTASQFKDFQKQFLKDSHAIYTSYIESTNHGSSLLELPLSHEIKWKDFFPPDGRSIVRGHGENIPLPTQMIRTKSDLVDLYNAPSLTCASCSYNKDLHPNIFFLRKPDFYNEFYQYYHWIRTGDKKTIDYFAYLFSKVFIEDVNESSLPYLLLLYLACFVQDPKNKLPEALNDPLYTQNHNERSAYFNRLVQLIHFNTRAPQYLSKEKSLVSPPVCVLPSPPLKHLKFEAMSSDRSFISDHQMIDLPLVKAPKIDLASSYLEKISSSQGETLYALKKGVSLFALKQNLVHEEKRMARELEILEEKLLSAAYPEPIDFIERKKEAAAILSGHYLFGITLSSLIGLFLEGSYEGFLKAIPRLSKKEIKELNLHLQEFLIQTAYSQQIKRSLALIEPLLNMAKVDAEAITSLGEELFAQCSYQTNLRPGLVFEALSNKRLRPEQSVNLQEIITKMESKEPFLLSHMIMGFGKTDIFASLLGRLWARSDQLSLFLTPSAQLKTVQANLTTSQWRNFGQGICTFDYKREDLTLAVLKDIHQELIDALSNQRMVVLQSEMPQILELEFVSLVCRPELDTEKIRVLQDILTLFWTKTSVVIDEADEVFRTDREINFPTGERLQLNQSRVSFISQIFRSLALDPVLRSLIDLRRNTKKPFSLNDYKTILLPRLSEILSSDPIFRNVPSHLLTGFKRYLLGAIDPELEKIFTSSKKVSTQAYNDVEFLRMRDRLSTTHPEVAHLMALGRHLLQDILPQTLQKTTNREYGRLSKNRGKVVPYIAAGVPSTTEFGAPWELVAYHFQTALSEDLSEPLISLLVERSLKVAKYQSLMLNCPIHETPIFLDFKKFLGVSLLEMENASKLSEFLNIVNADPIKKLFIEEKLIQEEVFYDPNYFSSNGHNLMMFQRVLSMTGTPYNCLSYPMKLMKDASLDLDSITALTHRLLERNGEIHQVPDLSDLQDTLSKILKNSKQGKRLRALIDVGGCLLAKSNTEYAKVILEVFNKDPAVQGVVFFRGGDGKEKKALSLLKKGELEPIDLVDTDLTTWKAQGVDPSRLFFFYDQLHSRGTDFPLPSDTVGLVLLKHNDQMHSILQGAARLRKLSKNQDVIFALSESSAKTIQEEGIEKLNIESLLKRSLDIEKDILRKQIYRHYIQEMHNAVRSCHLEQLLLAQPSNAKGDPSLLMVRQGDCLYQEYGKIPIQIPTMQKLNEYKDQLIKEYADRYPGIKTSLHTILKDAEAHLADLPETVPIQSNGLNRKLHTQIQKEIEHQNTKLIELEKEWQTYQIPPATEVQRETQWAKYNADFLLNQVSEKLDLSKCGQKCRTLKEILFDYYYSYPYPVIFEDHLHATSNWHVSRRSPLPIFSSYHKPAKQMLVIEHGKEGNKQVSGLLLSLAESEFFRRTYLPNQPKDLRMWLIDSDGHCINQAKTPLPETQKMDELMIQMNVLNGHADWITKNLDKSLKWLHKDPYKTKMKFRFLYLQALRNNNKEQMGLLMNHPKLQHDDFLQVDKETFGQLNQMKNYLMSFIRG